MLLKILLTILVIAGAVLTLRLRRGQVEAPASTAATSGRKVGHKLDTPIKIVAVGLAILMVVGVSAYLYHQWQDSYRVVTIRVIDTRSGTTSQYQAYKGDVDGRQFVTTDGLAVTLAEVERMELGGD